MSARQLLAAGLMVGAGVWLSIRFFLPVGAPAPERASGPGLVAGAEAPPFCSIGPAVVDDVSRLNPAEVSVVCSIEAGGGWEDAENRIRLALEFAASQDLSVSISAQRHSQGGHISLPGGLLLDLGGYRGVRLDPSQRAQRVVQVLSGTTWAEVQEVAHGAGLLPDTYGDDFARRAAAPEEFVPGSLSVIVQQSSNIFSVGGSLSVNCHGRDRDSGPIIRTVRSFRIMLADGRVVTASRDADPVSEEARLFRSAIGGFGLLGVILDVELDLRDNVMVEKETELLDYREYPSTLTAEVLSDPSTALHFGRLNIDELDDDAYLREMYTVAYRETPRIEQMLPLSTEGGMSLQGSFMELGEWTSLAKKARWEALLSQVDVPGRVELTTLNNAMRPPVQFLMRRAGIRKINILQEYFVPPEAFVPFVDTLRETTRTEGIDLQNVTTRFVPGNTEALLSYAPEDRIAVVLYINLWLSESGIESTGRWTRGMVDSAQEMGGSYYLAYQLWPTREQLVRSYPGFEDFLAEKRHFDPDGRFTNQFHRRYAGSW